MHIGVAATARVPEPITSPDVRPRDYGPDILATPRRRAIPELAAEPGTVVEDAGSGFCGAVLSCERGSVVLEDAQGRTRVFPMRPAAFLADGRPVTLVRPAARPTGPSRSASGSVPVQGLRARTARAGRIWVEGRHDAELVERVWGHDLRVDGVVVEALDGVDALAERVTGFGPGPRRRLGVLVDHLVPGSKESRLVAGVRSEYVLVTGHPYVDIWQAVRPAALGIAGWPEVPKGESWKHGVCRVLGWLDGAGEPDPVQGWQCVLGAVSSYRDLEPALLGSVEQLIDFVTAGG